MNISGYPPGLRTALWNIRSAGNKMSLLSQLFSDEELDLLFIVETWQIPSVPGKLDAFSAAFKEHLLGEEISANLFCMPRGGTRVGGGLALLSKSNLSLSPYKFMMPKPSTFELLCCKLRADRSAILICLYRIPSTSFLTFLNEFRTLLMAVSSQSLEVVIAGDFNVKVNIPDDVNTADFNSLLFEYNMVLIAPSSATHQLGNTLDFLVVSLSFSMCISPMSTDSTVTGSDHYPCFFSINAVPVTMNRPLVDTSMRRSIMTLDQKTVSLALKDKLKSLLTSDCTDFSEYLTEYRGRVVNVLDEMAPLRPNQHSVQHARPRWMDAEYVKQRSIRKRLQRRGDKSAYNAQRRYCQYLSKSKQISCNKRFIDDAVSTNDQKQIFKAVNKLLDRSKANNILPHHSDPLCLANSLNEYFVEKPVAIRNAILSPDITSSDSTEPLELPLTDSGVLTSFRPTTSDELSMLIKSHGIKVGPGDVLTPVLIKTHLPVLLPHFVRLVNLSLSSCSTQGLNEAHVVPILKSLDLDSDSFKSYRPVSLLSFVSKLTERVVHSRINQHLTDNSLHSPSQFGYKKNHGVETLMLKLLDDILVAVDRKFGVVMLIVDLSAAFDTVDHSLLIKILQGKYRIRGPALSWIKSFLSDRSQRVKVGSSLSESLAVLFGVPQGSILGPLLFNLYCSTINEAFSACGFNSMGYADDNFGSRIFTARTKLSTLSHAVPSCLSSIKDWANAHFLKLNMDKTEIVAFGSRNFLSSLNISTVRTNDGILLPVSRSTKILGFHLDNDLSLDCQVSHTCSSVNLVLRNLRLIRKSLDQATTETIVHSLITNKLDQCNALYVGCSRANIAKLQFLQNSALRLVLQLPPHCHISGHLDNLHWLSVEKRCTHKYLVLVFKCIAGLAPISLSEKIKLSSPLDMILDTSVFLPQTALGRRAFSYLGPRYWNALPRELRIVTGLKEFQAQLKHFLFEHFNDFMIQCNPYTTEHISFSQPSYSSGTRNRFTFI